MSRLIIFLFVLAVLINLTGCKHEKPTHTICLLDVSKSITPDGVKYEFKTVADLIDTMQRGDRLTLIPISGNAIVDTPGHVLRFTAPKRRQPYDQDLVAFRAAAHKQIDAMRDGALIHPSVRTDILGTLDLAGREFAADGQNDRRAHPNRTLLVLSDFIEDDGAYRFALDASLVSDVSARKLADRLQKETCLSLGGVHIRLSNLESTDLRSMTPQRRKAIRVFWSDYISQINRTRGPLQQERRTIVKCEENPPVFQ